MADHPAPVIALVFDSVHGHTRALSDAIAAGIARAGATARHVDLSVEAVTDMNGLAAYDALVFGTPTFMGGVSARFKAFMDASSDVWMDQPWRDRMAAGFTIGSSNSGDKLATLQHLSIFAAQHGMIWVGQDAIGPTADPNGVRGLNADGSWLGMMATSSRDKTRLIHDGDAATATRFGARIAHAAQRWRTGRDHTPAPQL